MIIPIFAMTALFVIPALIGLTAIVMWFKTRNRLYKTIEDAVEKNAPPEVIAQLVALAETKAEKEDKSSPVKHFTDGAVLLALGVAFLVFYMRGGPQGVIFPAVFLTLFGVAKFCIAAFVARHEKTEQ